MNQGIWTGLARVSSVDFALVLDWLRVTWVLKMCRWVHSGCDVCCIGGEGARKRWFGYGRLCLTFFASFVGVVSSSLLKTKASMLTVWNSCVLGLRATLRWCQERRMDREQTVQGSNGCKWMSNAASHETRRRFGTSKDNETILGSFRGVRTGVRARKPKRGSGFPGMEILCTLLESGKNVRRMDNAMEPIAGRTKK